MSSELEERERISNVEKKTEVSFNRVEAKTVSSEIRLQLNAQLKGHKDRVWSVAWSHNGQTLASTSGDKTIRIWSRSNPRSEEWVCVAVLDGVHSRTVRSVAWSPDGKYLASCSFDGLIGIWSYTTEHGWECSHQLEGHENEVKAVAWSVSGGLLASCGRDKSVWVWDAASDAEFECVSVLHGHTQDVKKVIWHPEEDWMVSCSYDDTMRVWTEEDDDWYCTQTLTEHKATVWDACFNKAGTRLVSVSDDLSVCVYEVIKDQVTQSPRLAMRARLPGAHARTIFSVDWGPGGLIATVSADDTVKLLRVVEHKTPTTSTMDTSATEVSSPPDSSASTSNEEEEKEEAVVELPWSVRCVSSLNEAHEADVNSVSWHPKDTSLLATAGDDNVVKVWQIC